MSLAASAAGAICLGLSFYCSHQRRLPSCCYLHTLIVIIHSQLKPGITCTCAVQPSWIDKASPIFQYTIPEDDWFYLEATSGVYPGELEDDNFLRRNLSWILGKIYGGTDNAPQSRNWIGATRAVI